MLIVVAIVAVVIAAQQALIWFEPVPGAREMALYRPSSWYPDSLEISSRSLSVAAMLFLAVLAVVAVERNRRPALVQKVLQPLAGLGIVGCLLVLGGVIPLVHG